MKISKKGIEFLINEEGFRNKAYRDIYDKWTIGIGHLIKPGEEYLKTKILTDKEVMDLFFKDVKEYEDAVNSLVYVPMKQREFDSLVSFAFNIGTSQKRFPSSSVLKLANLGGTDEEIIKAFSNWHSHGDLKKRRAREARLYLTGNYSYNLTTQDLNKFYINPTA